MILGNIYKSFIFMVLFYDWKLSKIGIHGNEVFIFAWDLENLCQSAAKHTTLNATIEYILSTKRFD